MNEVEKEYQLRYEHALLSIADQLAAYLTDLLRSEPRIDRITTRPKSVERFAAKANALKPDGDAKYLEPFAQIQDQIGARIITFYECDVDRVSAAILKYFRPIESKTLVPEREWEFGYFGRHHVLLLPPDVVNPTIDPALVPYCFELQVKTLFQHAWSEANHDLGYKPGTVALKTDEARQLAYTSAQAWGADRMFNELFQQRHKDSA